MFMYPVLALVPVVGGMLLAILINRGGIIFTAVLIMGVFVCWFVGISGLSAANDVSSLNALEVGEVALISLASFALTGLGYLLAWGALLLRDGE